MSPIGIDWGFWVEEVLPAGVIPLDPDDATFKVAYGGGYSVRAVAVDGPVPRLLAVLFQAVM
jgi:hypothetical protein